MSTHTHLPLRRSIQATLIGAACIASSFAVGVQTAGEVRPVALIEAGSITGAGDMDGNGTVDLRDVAIILDVTQGYTQATPEQLLADPSGNGQLSVDDALRLLDTLSAS